MPRRLVPALLALLVLTGCAGSSRLAQRGEEKLASGENGRAWDLAIRSLRKDPGNTRARAVANTAGNAMARDWEQRIRALALSDSLAAAEQVLQLAQFRVDAAPFAAISVAPDEARAEMALRTAAASSAYRHAVADLAAKRPKSAFVRLNDAQRFVADYRDAAKLADRAYEKALTRVAIAPFASARPSNRLGREVAARWRDDLARQLAPPDARFTRVLGTPEIEGVMSASALGRLSRADAIAAAKKAGAQRVVWGNVGDVESRTRLQLYTDHVWRRVTGKDTGGATVTRWIEVPIEVVARVRTVNVDVDYEVIATREGATLAHQHAQRSTTARVVWTSFSPEGDLDAYALVPDALRAADPARAAAIEKRWKETCGEGTTLRQVLEARRAVQGSGSYRREVLERFAAGTAFVFLQELPPAEDLAYAALADSWRPLHADLLKLDPVDDVDLGMTAVAPDGR